MRSWGLDPQLSPAPDAMDFGAVIESGSKTTVHHVFLQRSWRKFAAQFAGGAQDAEQLWVDLRFHEAAGHDLFVTGNAELLGTQRYRGGHAGSRLGVSSPSEAMLIVEAMLRARGTVVVDIGVSHQVQVDVSSFRAAVSEARMPIVWRTACLDCIAWIVCDLEGVSVDRKKISWKALRENSAWVKALQDPRAQAIAHIARTHQLTELTNIVQHLRDAVSHRRPFSCAVLQTQPTGVRATRDSDFAIAVIDIEESLDPVNVNVVNLPGVFSAASHHWLMPHEFVAGLARSLAEIVNATLDPAGWIDDGWWRGSEREADHRWHDQLLAIGPAMLDRV